MNLSHFSPLGGTSSILRTFLGGTSQKRHPVHCSLSSDGSEEGPDCLAAGQEEAEVAEEEELLRRAIALSLEATLEDDEDDEELLKQAIALSLSD